MANDNLQVVLPPHWRITSIMFQPADHVLQVSLAETAAPCKVPAEHIRAFFGARILREVKQIDNTTPLQRFLTFSTWPRSLRPHTQGAQTLEEVFDLAIAMRVAGVAELWFLIAESFNFCATLGSAASYSTRQNFAQLMQQLVAFAPTASQDRFFRAFSTGRALPPSMNSLFEFFRAIPAED